MAVTIYDVAKHAGVSTATVSRVINKAVGVKPKTRSIVLQSIEQLGFYQNYSAAALVSGRTGIIGLLVPNIINPFYSQVADGVYRQAQALGIDVITITVAYEAEQDFKILRHKALDGLLIIDIPKSIVEKLFFSYKNLVLIGNDYLNGQTSCVVTDNAAAIELAMKHLIDCGHSRITLLTEPPVYDDVNQRIRTYYALMDEFGLNKYRYVRRSEGASIEDGIKVGMEWATDGIEHTAIIATNDMLAIGLMRAMKNKGIRIPQDISICGFDGTWIASLLDPALSTVAQPMHEMGSIALDLLLDLLKQEKPSPRKVVLNPVIVLGESVSILTNSDKIHKAKQ